MKVIVFGTRINNIVVIKMTEERFDYELDEIWGSEGITETIYVFDNEDDNWKFYVNSEVNADKLCKKLNKQQATIDKLDQENADLLGARIKAQEEWEKCTDKLKEKIVEQQAIINKLTTKCSRLAKEKDELSDEIGQLNYAWSDKVSRLLDFVEEQGQVSRQQIKEWWNDE